MSGDLWVRESGAEVHVEWRVERFLSLASQPNHFLHSPPFSLWDAQWFLEMEPNGWCLKDSSEWMHLALRKRFSTSKKQSIGYTLGIRRTDGSVYKSIDREEKFQKYGEGERNPVVRVSKLRGSRNVLSVNKVLTVFATLRLTGSTLLDEDIPRTLPLQTTHTEEVNSEWKVEGFVSLPKEEGFSLDSPAFSFAGAEWYLEVYPNNKDFTCTDWVSLCLRRGRSSSEEQTIAYTLGIRRRNGTPYRFYHGEKEFGTDDEWVWWNLIKSSEVLDSPNGLVHQGSVTFFCTLRADNTATPTERGTPTSSGPSYEEGDSQTTPSEEEAAHSSVKNLLEHLKDLAENGHHGDVTFEVNDQAFPAHRSILSSRSPVFFGMFENDTEEKRTGIVTITDFQPDTIKDLLSFLYTGDVAVVTSSNAVQLYKAADKYDIQHLKEAALRCMTRELSPEIFFDVVVLASVFEETKFIKTASAFFVENVKLITAQPPWITFLKEHSLLANELLQLVLNEKM